MCPGHVLRRAVAFGALAMFGSSLLAMGNRPAQPTDEKAVLERIKPVARIEFGAPEAAPAATAAAAPAGAAAATAPAAAGGKSGAEIVKNLCSACHDSGAAGAPKTGDNAAWAPRIALGYDALLQSAAAGKGSMPPKGGGGDLSMLELGRAVVYIANKSGASFKEPTK